MHQFSHRTIICSAQAPPHHEAQGLVPGQAPLLDGPHALQGEGPVAGHGGAVGLPGQEDHVVPQSRQEGVESPPSSGAASSPSWA